jgi:hypothetical protein
MIYPTPPRLAEGKRLSPCYCSDKKPPCAVTARTAPVSGPPNASTLYAIAQCPSLRRVLWPDRAASGRRNFNRPRRPQSGAQGSWNHLSVRERHFDSAVDVSITCRAAGCAESKVRWQYGPAAAQDPQADAGTDQQYRYGGSEIGRRYSQLMRGHEPDVNRIARFDVNLRGAR